MSSQVLTAIFRAVDEITPAVRNIEASTGRLSSTLSGVRTAIVGAFSVGAIAAAIGKFAEFTGKLTDMSARTGISTTALQTLQMAFAQAGVSIDTVTRSIGMMARNLLDGKIDKLLGDIGLSAADLKTMAPDKAFIAIADAIAQIPNPMERMKVAFEIGGRAMVEALAGMDGKLAETTASFERMGLVLSEDVVAAGDKFGDTMAVLKTAGMALIAQVLAPMLPALTELARWLGSIAAGALPAMRSGFESLVGSGLRVNVWLMEFAEKAAVLSSRMPTLRNLMGESGRDVAYFSGEAQKARDTLEAFTRTGVQPAEAAVRKMPPVLGDYGDALKRAEEAQKKAAAEAERAKKAADEFAASIDFFGTRLDAFNHNALAPYAAGLSDAAAKADIFTATLPPLASTTDVATRALNEAWRAAGKFATEVKSAGEKSVSAFADAMKGLPNVILNAFTGGGDVLKSIGSSLGTSLATDFVTNFGSKVTGALGNALGGAINSILPGLGALLGPLMSKVGDFFKGLFGGIPEDVKKARTEIDAFQESLHKTLTTTQLQEAGGQKWAMTVIAVRDAFLNVGKTAEEAQAIVAQLWDTDNPDKARAAMEAINAVLDQQKDKHRAITEEIKTLEGEMERLKGESTIGWKDMQEAAQRYGIDLASLGPQFQSGRLHEAAQQIWDDFVLLKRGGADVGAVVLGMKDKIVTLADESKQFGVQIPANFKPLIDSLLASTQLTEDERAKLQALGAENFGDPMVAKLDKVAEEMKKVGDRIAELVAKLTGPLQDAINRIPTTRTIDVDVRYNDPGFTPRGDGGEHEGFDAGTVAFGSWFRNFGAGQTVRLHGEEAVVRKDQAGAFAAAHGGGGLTAAEMRTLLREQRQDLAYAIGEALILKGPRR